MSCEHPNKVIEAIYLTTGSKRQKIASVIFCPRLKFPTMSGCGHPLGDPKREPECPKDFALGWRTMIELHPWAPFYFERVNGQLVPEGHKKVPAPPPDQDEIEEVPFE